MRNGECFRNESAESRGLDRLQRKLAEQSMKRDWGECLDIRMVGFDLMSASPPSVQRTIQAPSAENENMTPGRPVSAKSSSRWNWLAEMARLGA